MDLQFVSSGEDAVDYAVKAVCYATTRNLSVSPLPRHSLGYTAAESAVDSYRPPQAGDESLTGSRVVHPC